MIVNKIEDFAEEMKDLGAKHNYQPLIRWGKELYSSAISFDIENMKKILRNFEMLAHTS